MFIIDLYFEKTAVNRSLSRIPYIYMNAKLFFCDYRAKPPDFNAETLIYFFKIEGVITMLKRANHCFLCVKQEKNG